MNTWQAALSAIALAVSSAAIASEGALILAQGTQQDLKGMESAGQRNDAPTMTRAQQAQYREQCAAAKAKWAAMTPQEKSTAIAAARTRKLSELSALELVGQRDDMQRETAAQTAQYKAEAEAAKTKWDQLTPAEKQAVRKSAWQEERSEFDRDGSGGPAR